MPSAIVAVQELTPSLTVTYPVGAVGVFPKAPVTLNAIVTVCPSNDGLGRSEVIAVVVLALLTVSSRTLELPDEVLSLST